MTNIETALTPITEAQRMLAQAKTLPELRNLRDYATTAKAWAKARGMGIDAENEATEVILRAEREIGKSINALRDEGRVGIHAGAGARKVNAARWNIELPDEGDSTPLRVQDLGLNYHNVEDFSRLALLPDDRFEAMIRSVREIEGARLAKANFYKAMDKAQRERAAASGGVEVITPMDSGLDAFLRATNSWLGWEVNDDGSEGPTRNGLFQLADDELRTVATRIRALAVAFNEVRASRG